MTLVRQLRGLYTEDVESGHIETIQELFSAARPGTALAASVAEQTRRWEALAEEVIRSLLRGSPLARFVNPAVVARAVIAHHLGLQTLTYLDADANRMDALLAEAERLAAAYDTLPRVPPPTAPHPPVPM